MSILSDLLWCGVVFLAAWVVFLMAYIVAAGLGWVRNLDGRLVVMAFASAVVTGALSALLLAERFSSPNVLWLASVAAPVAFIGFCGMFILVGPANVDRSVTFTILRAVKAQEGADIPSGRLVDIVPFDRIFSKRLHELSTHGVIEVQGNRVRLTPRGERVRRFFVWLGTLLNVKPQ